MIKAESKKLLQDEKVIVEINRHKWFESEKVGYDIGFEKAAEDWISRFSQSWLKDNTGNASDARETKKTAALAKSRLKK